MTGYTISTQEILLRLLLAALLGAIVGWERERKEGTAGLRTHMLVCIGSALIMLVSMFGFKDILGQPNVVLDPSRVAAQVISGIGFLGAGTIFFLRPHIVKGLTTAAGLWTVAAVGLAAGGGLYLAATITTLLVFVILALIKPVEGKIKNMSAKNMAIMYETGKVSITDIEAIFKEAGLQISGMNIRSLQEEGMSEAFIFFWHTPTGDILTQTINKVKDMDGVKEVRSRR
jgi:putative Mg2+ transporter-C (MgtC) family protein